MNFIGRMDDAETQVELKYCERCGGLWLRRQGASGVYCASCRARLAAMPNPGEAPPRKARPRRKGRGGKADIHSGELEYQGHIEHLDGVAAMEVRA